jgi:hypothetical protein
MASKNYVVLKERLTFSEEKEYKVRALSAGLERCGVKGIGEIAADIPALQSIPVNNKADRVRAIATYLAGGLWPRTIDQRQLAPLTDLVVPTGLDDWLTAALAVVGNAYSCFQAVAAPQTIQGKLLVLWGISVETVPIPVSRLIIRKGGAAGNILAQYDLNELAVADNAVAVFSEPVVIDPQDIFAVQVRASIATGAAARVYIHNYLFENAGQVIA